MFFAVVLCLHFVSNIVLFFVSKVVICFVSLFFFLFFVFLFLVFGFLLNFVAQQALVISCTVFLIYCMPDTVA